MEPLVREIRGRSPEGTPAGEGHDVGLFVAHGGPALGRVRL